MNSLQLKQLSFAGPIRSLAIVDDLVFAASSASILCYRLSRNAPTNTASSSSSSSSSPSSPSCSSNAHKLMGKFENELRGSDALQGLYAKRVLSNVVELLAYGGKSAWLATCALRADTIEATATHSIDIGELVKYAFLPSFESSSSSSSSSIVVVGTVHNRVQFWRDNVRLATVRCVEHSILYSMKIKYSLERRALYVVGGTVFGPVLLWQIAMRDGGDDDALRQLDALDAVPVGVTLSEHRGSVFGVDIVLRDDGLVDVASCSDDRSVCVWHGVSLDADEIVAEPTVLQGHTARVWRVLLHNDSVFSVGEDCVSLSWRRPSYEPLARFEGHRHKNAWSLALDARRETLVTGGGDGTVRVWDVEQMALRQRGDRVYKVVEHESTRPAEQGGGASRKSSAHARHRCRALAWARDVDGKRRRLFVATSDGRLLRSAVPEAAVQLAECPELRVCDLSVPPCGRHVLVASETGHVAMIDADSGALLCMLEQPGRRKVERVECVTSEHAIMSCFRGSDSSLVCLMRIVDGATLSIVSEQAFDGMPPSFHAVERAADGSVLIAVGDRNGRVHLLCWRRDDDSVQRSLASEPLHGGKKTVFLRWAASADYLYAVGANGQLAECAVDDRDDALALQLITRRAAEGGGRAVLDLTEGDNGDLFLSGFAGPSFSVYNATTGSLLAAMQSPNRRIVAHDRLGAHALQFALATGSRTEVNSVLVREFASCSPMPASFGDSLTPMCSPLQLNAVAALDARWLVTGGEDSNVYLMQLRDDGLLHTHRFVNPAYTAPSVGALCFVPSLAVVVAACSQASLCMWRVDCDARAARALAPIDCDARNTGAGADKQLRLISVAAFESGTGTLRIVVGTAGQRALRCYDVAPSRDFAVLRQFELDDHRRPVLSIDTANVDGRVLVVAGATDGSIVLLDGSSDGLAMLRRFDTVHQSGVNDVAVALSPSGNSLWIAAGGDDQMLSVVELDITSLATCEPRWHRVHSAHSSSLKGVALLAGRDLIATTASDQRVSVWQMPAAHGGAIELRAQLLTHVADVSSLSIAASSSNQVSISVAGQGIALYQLSIDDK
jgi:WD40 repeat protein